MATNYVNAGETVTFTAAGAITKGEIAVVGTALFGVAHDTYANGDTAVIYLTGVWDLPKEAALAINAGDLVYWDDVAKEIDTTNTNLAVGVCVADAAGGDATVRVRLQQTAA